jgi:hypothetical protein
VIQQSIERKFEKISYDKGSEDARPDEQGEHPAHCREQDAVDSDDRCNGLRTYDGQQQLLGWFDRTKGPFRSRNQDC